jgi:hypothetical protein
VTYLWVNAAFFLNQLHATEPVGVGHMRGKSLNGADSSRYLNYKDT